MSIKERLFLYDFCNAIKVTLALIVVILIFIISFFALGLICPFNQDWCKTAPFSSSYSLHSNKNKNYLPNYAKVCVSFETCTYLADRGNLKAKEALSRYYFWLETSDFRERGYGPELNAEYAINLLEESYYGGNISAAELLGHIYRHGWYKQELAYLIDADKAEKWYINALTEGNSETAHLNLLYLNLLYSADNKNLQSPNYIKAYAWYKTARLIGRDLVLYKGDKLINDIPKSIFKNLTKEEISEAEALANEYIELYLKPLLNEEFNNTKLAYLKRLKAGYINPETFKQLGKLHEINVFEKDYIEAYAWYTAASELEGKDSKELLKVRDQLKSKIEKGQAKALSEKYVLDFIKSPLNNISVAMQDNKRLADALYEQVTLNKDVSLRTFKNYLDIRKHLRREQCVDYSYRYFNLNFDNSHYLYALAFKEDKLLTKGHLKFLVDKKTVLLSTDLDFKDEYGSFLDSHSQDKKFCRASALSSETTSILNSDTYYVQDIHFLLSKVYKINLSVRTSMGSFIDVYFEN